MFLIYVIALTIISVVFGALIKRFTMPFIGLIYTLFLLPTLFLKDWLLLGIVVLFFIAIFGYKFYLNREELPMLDFNKRITSLRGLLNSAQPVKEDELTLGRVFPTGYSELKYNNKLIAIDNEIQRGHSLCTGASGSGKTVFLKSMMRQKLAQGHSLVWVDMKGDVEVLDELKSVANKLSIPYYEFSVRDCNFSYDPFVNLNETGKVEAFMNTRQWSSNGSDAHYKTQTQLLIQTVIRDYDLYRIKEHDESNYILGLYSFLLNYNPGKELKEGYLTFLKQIEIILTSKGKELFEEKANKFTFEKETQYIVAFSFVSANKSLANSLMSFILQDILDRGIRKRFTKELFICIDEFGTLDSPILIKDLLEKGRSGGCQVLFSILDINQLSITTNEHFVHSILGTINNFVIFAGATQRTAEILAGVQKYGNKDFDIMSLRKPYKGKGPTALVISKFPLIRKGGNQEIFRIEPFIYQVNKEFKVIDNKPEVIEIEVKEEIEEVEEDIYEGSTISNVDDFL